MILQPSHTLSLSNYTTNNQSKSWMNNYKDNDYIMMPIFHWLTDRYIIECSTILLITNYEKFTAFIIDQMMTHLYW